MTIRSKNLGGSMAPLAPLWRHTAGSFERRLNRSTRKLKLIIFLEQSRC